MSYSFLSSIKIDKGKAQAVYVQLAQELALVIKQGIVKPGQKLPGSRTMAELLLLNRNTITLALEELQAQGWIVIKNKSGAYVNDALPEIRLQQPAANIETNLPEQKFDLEINELLLPPQVSSCRLQFNDGEPDIRLSPLNELGREYHRLLKKTGYKHLFSYNYAEGDPELRKVIAGQLNEFRGFDISEENVFITRGSIMAIYLLSRVCLKPGDKVAIAELNYMTGNLCFENTGAKLIRVPLDEKGMQTEELENILAHEKIRLLYITSHHQHPTTVCLAPERRLHLYELAKKHSFLIIEDDYDFDYHYKHKPTLPIAGLDKQGLVAYIGSYSKIIYPGIRLGYLVASPHIIKELVKYRRIVDRQGDHLLERAIANLFKDGTMQRYLRKSIKIYEKRKEFFCAILEEEFKPYLDFTEPEGGMAVWVKFKNGYDLEEISKRCAEQQLSISSGVFYDPPGKRNNACRLGFVHMNEIELREACDILLETFRKFKQTS
ncbi:MAG: PLP-dependent aminotransferase family protein [Cyclobacteriaceae bacterium]